MGEGADGRLLQKLMREGRSKEETILCSNLQYRYIGGSCTELTSSELESVSERIIGQVSVL